MILLANELVSGLAGYGWIKHNVALFLLLILILLFLKILVPLLSFLIKLILLQISGVVILTCLVSRLLRMEMETVQIQMMVMVIIITIMAYNLLNSNNISWMTIIILKFKIHSVCCHYALQLIIKLCLVNNALPRFNNSMVKLFNNIYRLLMVKNISRLLMVLISNLTFILIKLMLIIMTIQICLKIFNIMFRLIFKHNNKIKLLMIL